MNKVIKYFLKKREYIRGKLFDYRYNINTLGFIGKDQLKTSSSYKNHATAYQDTGNSRMNRILKAYRMMGGDANTFLDIGCGMGKACFYAVLSGYFNQVIGIDFDENLIDIANKNLSRFKGKKNISFLLEDAVNYKIEKPDTLVFISNPFDGIVLEKFLLNNLEQFKQGAKIAYAKDVESDTLLKMNFRPIFKHRSRELSLWEL